MTLAGYFGLVIGIYVWHMWIEQTPDHAISIMLIIQLGPLMFPLRGLLAGKVYDQTQTFTFAYYCSAVLLVLAALVTFLVKPPQHKA